MIFLDALGTTIIIFVLFLGSLILVYTIIEKLAKIFKLWGEYKMSLDEIDEYEEREIIAAQVDYWGEESLTENQQALYRGYITFQKYMALENDKYLKEKKEEEFNHDN